LWSGEEGLIALLQLLLIYRFMVLRGGRWKQNVRWWVVGKAAIAVLILRAEITRIASGKKTKSEETNFKETRGE
jgi:hypothetical protein